MLMQPFYFLCRAVIGLCRSVKHKRKILCHRQELHVLHQHGIDGDVCQLAQQLTYIFYFVLINQGVDGDKDACIKLMGITTKGIYVINAIACGCPGPKAGRTNIDGIGSMIDGSDARLQILCRSKQF